MEKSYAIVIDYCPSNTNCSTSLLHQIVLCDDDSNPPTSESSYTLNLDTKYYEAKVDLIQIDPDDQISFESIEALVLRFDGVKLDKDKWIELVKKWNPEIRLLVCDRMVDDNLLEDTQKWCSHNEFELIELDPTEESRNELIDCGEKIGFQRIIQVFNSHCWSTAQIKGRSAEAERDRLMRLLENGTTAGTAEEVATLSLEKDTLEKASTSQVNDQTAQQSRDTLLSDDDMELFRKVNVSGEEDPGENSFEELFGKFSQMKEKANAMPLEQRKQYAEQVTMAFWKAIGGDEAEIAGLDEEID